MYVHEEAFDFNLTYLEWFSIECRKTQIKAITMANHSKRKQYNKPIKTRSKYTLSAVSAGKRVRPKRDWFWFCIWLAEKVVKQNLTNSGVLSTLNWKPRYLKSGKSKPLRVLR